jgi:hypothetical protein
LVGGYFYAVFYFRIFKFIFLKCLFFKVFSLLLNLFLSLFQSLPSAGRGNENFLAGKTPPFLFRGALVCLRLAATAAVRAPQRIKEGKLKAILRGGDDGRKAK